MAIGDQDHGRVAMPVAAMLAGAVHQPLDLALGEIASFNCQVYDVWCALLGSRFHGDKLCLRVSDCISYTPLLNSQLTRDVAWHRCRCDHTRQARPPRLFSCESPQAGEGRERARVREGRRYEQRT